MSAPDSTRLMHLRVWRGSTRVEGFYQTYEVPFEEGMSVLDALRWIRARRDSSLAIRYSCINANACRTCMALVDGVVEYTCTHAQVLGRRPSRSSRRCGAGSSRSTCRRSTWRKSALGLATRTAPSREAAYRARAVQMVIIGDPFFSELESDARYRDLMVRLRLPIRG